jgi:hypothetical protein
MCDYSLACVSSRDAVEGERLIVHRFPNGVKGFVSEPEVLAITNSETSVWKKLWNWFSLQNTLGHLPACRCPALGEGLARFATYPNRDRLR